jgi:hypothetical protein
MPGIYRFCQGVKGFPAPKISNKSLIVACIPPAESRNPGFFCSHIGGGIQIPTIKRVVKGGE